MAQAGNGNLLLHRRPARTGEGCNGSRQRVLKQRQGEPQDSSPRSAKPARACGGPVRCLDKVGPMNSEQLQSLAVLSLAIVPVALLWWAWIRMLD